jgi:hypothetical protein
VARLNLKERAMLKIAAIVWVMIGTVFTGIAVMTILSVPALAAHDMKYLPIAALAGFIVAIPVAFVVAGRMTKTFAS